MSCPHLNTGTHTAVYRIHNPDAPESPCFTVCIKVQCLDCQTLFRFLGDHAGTPDDIGDALKRRLGSWVSDMGDELGAMIAPLDASEPLAQIAVLGRA